MKMAAPIHIGTIRFYDDICETAKAARHLKSRAAILRKFAKNNGPGFKLENKALGRAVTFLGHHPDPDYFGDEWWQILP